MHKLSSKVLTIRKNKIFFFCVCLVSLWQIFVISGSMKISKKHNLDVYSHVLQITNIFFWNLFVFLPSYGFSKSGGVTTIASSFSFKDSNPSIFVKLLFQTRFFQTKTKQSVIQKGRHVEWTPWQRDADKLGMLRTTLGFPTFQRVLWTAFPCFIKNLTHLCITMPHFILSNILCNIVIIVSKNWTIITLLLIGCRASSTGLREFQATKQKSYKFSAFVRIK